MTIGILILIVFLLAATMMFLRKIPALIALPLMAIAIAGIEVIAGKLTWIDLTIGVIADGSMRLVEPIIISFLGGMLSFLMQKSGVAESFIKRGAELTGDNPFVVSAIMLAIIAILFTTIGGLGAVIMVATIVLPILNSVGARGHIAGGIFLVGMTLGGLLNANNWAIYRNVLFLDVDVISTYALSVVGVMIPVALGFIAVELWRARVIKLRKRILFNGLAVLAVIAILLYAGRGILGDINLGFIKTGFKWVLLPVGILILYNVAKDAYARIVKGVNIPIKWYAYIIPLVPLIMILVFEIHFIPAFMIGFLYGFLVTLRRGSINMTSQAMIEGSSSVMPAVILMIGIGMLLSAILGPTPGGPGAYWHERQNLENVQEIDGEMITDVKPAEWPVIQDLRPLIENVIPSTPWGYVLVFTLLGPLALYRGPFNLWGLGYGIGGVFLASGLLPPAAIMGVLMSLGVIQGVSDPTNTQNVWLANELAIDVNYLMWKTLPYAWIVAFFGLLVSSFLYLI